MKILDSNKDYYDFYQNVPMYMDDTFTFDRRDSYNLSKEEFAHSFFVNSYRWRKELVEHNETKYVLLQVGCKFWLFELEVTDKDSYGRCNDYRLVLLSSWEDYTVNMEVLQLSEVYVTCSRKEFEKNLYKLGKNDYRIERLFNRFFIWKDDVKEERHIPILKNIGIAGLIDPLDIYLALEDYFSLQKTQRERTDPIDMSNDDKIIEHGFDIKNSFRNVK